MLYTHAFATGYVSLWTYAFAPMMALCFRQYIADEIKIVKCTADKVIQSRDMYRRCLKINGVMIFVCSLPLLLGMIFFQLGLLPNICSDFSRKITQLQLQLPSVFLCFSGGERIYYIIVHNSNVLMILLIVFILLICGNKLAEMYRIILVPEVYKFLSEPRLSAGRKLNFFTSQIEIPSSHTFQRMYGPVLVCFFSNVLAHRSEEFSEYVIIHIILLSLLAFFYTQNIIICHVIKRTMRDF